MSVVMDNETSNTDFQQLNFVTLEHAACHYASLGWKVFPLQPGTKLPYPGWSWKQAATSDLDTIRSWWKLYPDANIALATGAGSGIDALDIDRKNGHDGLRSYQAICQDRYTGPAQTTPTGGSHLLFTHTPALINFTHRGELGGLDMRTDGGYIVIAPSVTREGPYRWVASGSVPAMPPALRLACEQWSKQSNTQIVESPDVPEDLPDFTTLGLKPEHLNYLLHGDASPWNDDRSRAIYATAGALMYRLQDEGKVFGILCANEHAWAAASEHREFGDPAVWLWKYGIAKILSEVRVQSASEVFQSITSKRRDDPQAPAFFLQGSKVRTALDLKPRWIVKGIIEEGQVGLVYGDSQTFKSYLMLDMSGAVAMGGDWHGCEIASSGSVWFLAGEGNAILKRRLDAWRQAREIQTEDLTNLWLSESGLNLMDPQHQQFLHDQVVACGNQPPTMLVIDTLSTNAILDENNARDAGELVALCYRIARAWTCTVVLVHHVGKTNKGASRGSSVWQANTDFRIRVDRLPGDQRVTAMTVEKLKGAPEPQEPFIFEASTQTLTGFRDDDASFLTDLVFNRISKSDAETRKNRAKKDVRTLLTDYQFEIFTRILEIVTGQERMPLAFIVSELQKQTPLVTVHTIETVVNKAREHLDTAIENGKLVVGPP